MKTKRSIVWLMAAAAVAAAAIGTALYLHSQTAPSVDEAPQAISHYTCPMHPHVHEEKPGSCPICQMQLVPVYREGAPGPSADAEGPGVTITAERQRRIGITTSTARRDPLTKTIRTVGRVAFDPELAVAQREFIEIVDNVPSLREAAVSRLRLLGMTEREIDELEENGEADHRLYLPREGESVWIYAPLYEHELPLVEVGQSVEVSPPSSGTKWTGTVRAVDPVLDPMTRTARARVEVPEAGGKILPGSFLDAEIGVDLGVQLAIPKTAVLDTGVRQIAFVVRDGTRFEPREIRLGAETDEDRVVLSGLKEGETVVTRATFLVDSESRLKEAVSGATTPACPEAEAWDAAMSMCMPKAGSQ